MILDRMERLALYEGIVPMAREIAAAWAADDMESLSCQVTEKAYPAREEGKRRFEVHDHTIDVMIGREGAEIIHICPAEELETEEVLPPEKDARKLSGTARGTAAELRKGYFCAIFPGEAHMVGGKADGAQGIDKWVVKVQCAAERKE